MSKLETIPDEDGDDTGYGSTPPLISPGSGSAPCDVTQGQEQPAVNLLSPMGLSIAHRSAASSAATPETQPLKSLGLDISNFPLDYQIHLQYMATKVTNYHYSLSADYGEHFIHIMLAEATKSEILLNAVVAFSAYLSTVCNPDGKLKDFLQYYNRSVTLLLDALKRKDTHNVPTLLTILQLATIEVRATLAFSYTETNINCLIRSILVTGSISWVIRRRLLKYLTVFSPRKQSWSRPLVEYAAHGLLATT